MIPAKTQETSKASNVKCASWRERRQGVSEVKGGKGGEGRKEGTLPNMSDGDGDGGEWKEKKERGKERGEA